MAMEMIEENPQRIKRAEMVVAIPSYREAELIAYPTTQAALGLTRYFGDKECVLINCDNNSDDGTKEAFFGADTDGVPQMYLSTPPGVRGKGNNFRNLFRKVLELKAQAVVVVDADLKSITPRWIKHLGEPLFNDFGYVAPSTCATSTTALSPTPSPIPSPGPSTAAGCANPSAAISGSPVTWPVSTSPAPPGPRR